MCWCWHVSSFIALNLYAKSKYMNVAKLMSVYSVSQKKSPPEDLWQYFRNGWDFFNQILCAYYAFLSTVDYEFLFKYLQV